MSFFGGIKNLVKKIRRSITKKKLVHFMVASSLGMGSLAKNKYTSGIEEGITLFGKKISGIQAKEEAQKANKFAKQSAKDAQQQYDEQTKKAQQAETLLQEAEKERKRRLALRGTAKPQTLLGGYLGVSGGRSYLG